MPKPVCVPCKRFYRPLKNGVHLLEGKPIHRDTLPGNSSPDEWAPYKIWHADLWHCQGCGHELISGFGHSPMSEDYRPDFDSLLPSVTHTVNDC